MAFDPPIRNRDQEPAVASSGNWMTDHRARIALEESERRERKQQELLEQTCERNTPAERIRIWERRHGLSLPRDTNHPLLALVASQTDVALERVREEQQRRLGRITGETMVVPDGDSSGAR
jgi:hypothetical protein